MQVGIEPETFHIEFFLHMSISYWDVPKVSRVNMFVTALSGLKFIGDLDKYLHEMVA